MTNFDNLKNLSSGHLIYTADLFLPNFALYFTYSLGPFNKKTYTKPWFKKLHSLYQNKYYFLLKYYYVFSELCYTHELKSLFSTFELRHFHTRNCSTFKKNHSNHIVTKNCNCKDEENVNFFKVQANHWCGVRNKTVENSCKTWCSKK